MISILATAAALSAAPSTAPRTPKSEPSHKPNLVLIMTDQQVMDAMSCAGNPWLKTPAMDKLAADGVRFTRAYCSYPLSGPSRAAMMTGFIPSATGVMGNSDAPREEFLNNTIGHLVGSAGYECLYAGKWHVPEVAIPEGRGFEKVCPMDDRKLPAAVDKALAARDKSKPLFLVASFLDPHEICEYARFEALPYGPLKDEGQAVPQLPESFRLNGDEPEALDIEKRFCARYHDTYTYSEDDWRMYLWSYYRLCERVDAELGRILDILQKYDLYDSSMIYFCSDHGDGVAAHQWNQKWALWEESVNVPVIVKAPKGSGLCGVTNTTALTSTGIDIVPTFCDYAGVELDKDRFLGKSIRPVVEGKQTQLHESVYVETVLEGMKIGGWSVVCGDYKYILYQWGRNREALFNITTDKAEMHNLISDPASQTILKDLRLRLYEWTKHTGNPIAVRTIERIVLYQ